jgi:hypothetical protein
MALKRRFGAATFLVREPAPSFTRIIAAGGVREFLVIERCGGARLDHPLRSAAAGKLEGIRIN